MNTLDIVIVDTAIITIGLLIGLAIYGLIRGLR